jgi:ribonuclease VapC
MVNVVLDASAVIAVLRNEAGADMIASHMGAALISTVNLQEVIKALVLRGLTIAAARKIIDDLHLDIRAHETEDAYAAAALTEATCKHGSGLGDRTCMALAIAENVPVITTDREWTKLKIPGLTVKLAR